jgi:hypothetical protein
MTEDTLLIIPAYNEAKRIAGVVASVKGLYPGLDILVVDDGSGDSTDEVAKKAGAGVVSLPFNLGYGVALETGYFYAKDGGYKYILQMDADGQHEPKYLADLIRALKQGAGDLVIGSRFFRESEYQTGFARKIGSVIFAKIASFLTGQKITDSNSGFKALNKNVIDFFTSGYFPSDYPDADMIILLNRCGFKIAEVPVIMYANTKKNESMHGGVIKPMYYIFKMALSIPMVYLRKINYNSKIKNQNAE